MFTAPVSGTPSPPASLLPPLPPVPLLPPSVPPLPLLPPSVPPPPPLPLLPPSVLVSSLASSPHPPRAHATMKIARIHRTELLIKAPYKGKRPQRIAQIATHLRVAPRDDRNSKQYL